MFGRRSSEDNDSNDAVDEDTDTQPVRSNNPGGGGGNRATELELLRDILYGEQTRQDEKRFKELRDRFDGEQDVLRKEIKALTDQLALQSTETKRQIESVQSEARSRHDNLRSEFDHRVETLHQELSVLITSLEDKKASRHDMAQLLLDMSQSLRSDRFAAKPAASRPAPAAATGPAADKAAEPKKDEGKKSDK